MTNQTAFQIALSVFDELVDLDDWEPGELEAMATGRVLKALDAEREDPENIMAAERVGRIATALAIGPGSVGVSPSSVGHSVPLEPGRIAVQARKL